MKYSNSNWSMNKLCHKQVRQVVKRISGVFGAIAISIIDYTILHSAEESEIV